MNLGKYKTVASLDAEVLFKDGLTGNLIGYVISAAGKVLSRWSSDGKSLDYFDRNLVMPKIYGYFHLGDDAIGGMYWNADYAFFKQLKLRGDSYYLRVELTDNLKPIWTTVESRANVPIQSKAD